MSKRLDKIVKVLGKETIEELNAMDQAGLDTRIVTASEAMAEVRDELHKNPAYVSAKENLKDLVAGKREVDRRQKAIIEYALIRKNGGANDSEG